MTVALQSDTAAPVRATSQDRLPRIAFILSQFPEAHETFILREFVALEESGLDFVIFSLKPCRDKVIQKDAARFADRTYYPWQKARAPLRFGAAMRRDAFRVLPWGRSTAKSLYTLWAAGRFARLAVDLGVEHLHAHWATAPTSAAAIVSFASGLPFSFTAHAWDIFAGDRRLAAKAAAARFVVTCTKANVAAIQGEVAGRDAGKVILNYHGIPRSSFGTRRNNVGRTLRVAAVGRLVETKGFTHLLDALAKADFPFELTVAGDGPLRSSLERQALKLTNGSVRFTGTVDNEAVFEILGASDVLVMPSVIAANGDRDGIPNVVLEAMAVGLPVVASDISGLPEAVVDGQTGILVPPADADAIRAALSRLHRERKWGEESGDRGRRRVKELFCAEDNAAALYRIFAEYAGVRQR